MSPKGSKRFRVSLLTTGAKDASANEFSAGRHTAEPESTTVVAAERTSSSLPRTTGLHARPAEERKLIESMRKGSDLSVKGVSARGTETTDKYSLKGLGAALSHVETSCP